MLTGDIALGERRDVAWPSLLDEEDREFLRARSRLAVISGVGHQLVVQKPQETLAAAQAFVGELA
jgi:pimeloyl-ACP methyl ester carboxylesterase